MPNVRLSGNCDAKVIQIFLLAKDSRKKILQKRDHVAGNTAQQPDSHAFTKSLLKTDFLPQVTTPKKLLANYLGIRLVREAQQVGSLVTLASSDLDTTVVDPQITIDHDREGRM